MGYGEIFDKFQSTRPCGARLLDNGTIAEIENFNPRAPAGRDSKNLQKYNCQMENI